MEKPEQEPKQGDPSRPHSRRESSLCSASRSRLRGTITGGSRGPVGDPTQGFCKMLGFLRDPPPASPGTHNASGPRTATASEPAGSRGWASTAAENTPETPGVGGRPRLRAIQSLRAAARTSRPCPFLFRDACHWVLKIIISRRKGRLAACGCRLTSWPLLQKEREEKEMLPVSPLVN